MAGNATKGSSIFDIDEKNFFMVTNIAINIGKTIAMYYELKIRKCDQNCKEMTLKSIENLFYCGKKYGIEKISMMNRIIIIKLIKYP